MSWLEKLLDKNNIINTRKTSIPEAFGPSARLVNKCCIE